MPDELSNFQTNGPTWQERAERYDGLAAVYDPSNPRVSKWLSLISLSCLEHATSNFKQGFAALDFGCGIGQLTYALSRVAERTMGVDITPGMLVRARRKYLRPGLSFEQIDGVHLPVESNSIDLIWVCGVLRYSLLVENPQHKNIVDEFLRVLKPGGKVYNLEMHVDIPSEVFSRDFLQGGFRLNSVDVVHIRRSRFDRIAVGKYQYLFLRKWWAELSILWTRLRHSKKDLGRNIRDYFFEYQKPI